MVFTVMLSGTLTAQDHTLNGLYGLDPFQVMPSYAGLSGRSTVSMTYRSQWENLPGAPEGFSACFNSPWHRTGGSVGVRAERHSSGLHVRQDFMAHYHQVFETEDYLVSAGGGFGYSGVNLNSSRIRTPDGEYGSGILDHQDPLLNASGQVNHFLTAGLSSYVQTRWLEGGIDYRFPVFFAGVGTRFYRPGHVVRLMLSRSFTLGDWTLQAFALDLTDLRVNQEELQCLVRYRNQYQAGLLWRGLRSSSLDAAGGQFAFNLGRGVWLAYLMEWPLNSLKKPIGGINQQFGLKFDFNTSGGSGRPPIIYNPRW